MPDLWRISHFPTLDGEGGLRYSARWHNAGRPIVYLAESPAGALLEILVHLELDPLELPPSYTLLRIHVESELACPLLDIPAESWKSDQELSRRLGDEWLAKNASALTRVPSAILPHTFNVLFNPLHPEAARVSIREVIPASFDHKLFRDHLP